MSTYDFYLRNDNGRYDYDTRISLPSVTTIVSAVLAKPQLVPWAYERTIDAVTGLFSQVFNARAATSEEIADTMSDYDLLDEWVRENKVHYSDVADAASERGKAAHKLLANLAGLHKQEGADAALEHAEHALGSKGYDDFCKAVASWWLTRRPRPLESEKVVFSLRHRYAGRLDLLADLDLYREEAEPTFHEATIVDLKTRRAGLGTYTSDQVQLGGYKIAAEERGLLVGRTAVLLAHDDGTYKEAETWVEPGAFLKVVDLYYMLRKTAVE